MNGADSPRWVDDYYELLEIDPGATEDQIRAAFRRAVRASHPDLNPGDSGAPERMVRINRAARILLDPLRRTAYDRARVRRRTSAPATPDDIWWSRADDDVRWSEPSESDATRAARARDDGTDSFTLWRSWHELALLRVAEQSSQLNSRAQLGIAAMCIALALCALGAARPRSLALTSDAQAERPTSIDPRVLHP